MAVRSTGKESLFPDPRLKTLDEPEHESSAPASSGARALPRARSDAARALIGAQTPATDLSSSASDQAHDLLTLAASRSTAPKPDRLEDLVMRVLVGASNLKIRKGSEPRF